MKSKRLVIALTLCLTLALSLSAGLWQLAQASDTVIVSLVKDMGESGKEMLQGLNTLNDTLFFTAYGAPGFELWKSDGTAAGTVMVKVINPGSTLSHLPQDFTNVNGTLFFNANDGTNGDEGTHTRSGSNLVASPLNSPGGSAGEYIYGQTSLKLELIGSNFDLSTGLTTQRRRPSMAYNNVDNEYLVVWFDTRNSGNNDVFGQRVSATGALLGANIPIIEFAEAQIDPFVAYNSIDNQYLVAWKTQQPGFFNDARARRVSSTGTLLGNDFFVFDSGDEISITYNTTANEYLVTGRSPGIRGRRVDNNGSLVGTEIVITSAGAPAPNGQVVYNPNANEYLATWRDQIDQNLKAQRISASGALVGNVIVISSFPESGRLTASVAFDPNNDRYLVVFGVFQEMRIMGQFLSTSGQLIGANFPIATGLVSRSTPYIAYSNNDSAFVVVWEDGGDIVGQLLSDDGDLIGDTLVIAQGTALADLPTLAYNVQTGEFLVHIGLNKGIDRTELTEVKK